MLQIQNSEKIMAPTIHDVVAKCTTLAIISNVSPELTNPNPNRNFHKLPKDRGPIINVEIRSAACSLSNLALYRDATIEYEKKWTIKTRATDISLTIALLPVN
jgi:hypothetical protein